MHNLHYLSCLSLTQGWSRNREPLDLSYIQAHFMWPMYLALVFVLLASPMSRANHGA